MSWQSGLAMLALIHHKHPNLIGDFSQYKAETKQDMLANYKKAFSVAESLGVIPLIDAEDMVEVAPEPKSTQLYVSSLYAKLK